MLVLTKSTFLDLRWNSHLSQSDLGLSGRNIPKRNEGVRVHYLVTLEVHCLSIESLNLLLGTDFAAPGELDKLMSCLWTSDRDDVILEVQDSVLALATCHRFWIAYFRISPLAGVEDRCRYGQSKLVQSFERIRRGRPY